MERDFDIEDIKLEDDLYVDYRDSKIGQYVNSPREMAVLIGFLMNESKTNYPTKKQLLTNANLLQRQQLMNRRMYYTPVIAAQAQLDNVFWRGGLAAEPNPGITYTDLTWNVGRQPFLSYL